MAVVVRNRDGATIGTVKEWGELASPGRGRWREGRSAKQLAKLWIAGEGQRE